MLRKLLAFYCYDASQSTDGCLCGLCARDDEINKFITEMKFHRSRWISAELSEDSSHSHDSDEPTTVRAAS